MNNHQSPKVLIVKMMSLAQVLILFLSVLSRPIESNLVGTSMTNHQKNITNKLDTEENQNIQSWTPPRKGRTGCKRNITIGMHIERFLNNQIGRLDSLRTGLLDIRDAFVEIEDHLEELLHGGRTDLLDW